VTFALPDLRSRVPMHLGNGFVQGEVSGTEAVTLGIAEIPPHTHRVQVGSAATTVSPETAIFAGSKPRFAPVCSARRLCPGFPRNGWPVIRQSTS